MAFVLEKSGLPPDTTSIVQRALAEDIGPGDVTTLYTVPEDAEGTATVRARENGIAAGLPVAAHVFAQVDPSLEILTVAVEGHSISAGDALITVSGRARNIFMAERVALNFVQRMCGIATLTAAFVALVGENKARVVDTRKTTPGLRGLEKYAVRAGGGFNHRFGLYDAVMIKDNHIAACGGISAAVAAAYRQAPHTMTVTVECDTLEQVSEAIEAGADIVLLDNMSISQLISAVEIVNGQAAIEASGGITTSNIAEVAGTGVDIISVGALTHSAPALDIGLDFKITSRR